MDSPNSGSLQSSSGGDEQEYDSRTQPPFLNISTNFGHFTNPLSLLPNHHHHQQQQHTNFFDPSQNFFHSFNNSSPNNLNTTSLLNLDLPGSRVLPLRTDLDCTRPTTAGSSMPNNAQLGVPSQGGPSVPSMHLRSNGGRSSSPSDQAQGVAAGRNPKKRTRASRRAPTTVLTTDTSNFRAMVQEFTGIPAPPFSGSPYTRRFDLFGSGMRSSEPITGAASSLYPLRPSAQKVHQQIHESPFLFSSSSSLMNNTNTSSTNINTNTNTSSSTSIPITSSGTNFNPSTSSSSSINYEHQNLLNLQNQMLSFHSISPNSSSLNVAAGLMNNPKSMLPFEEMGHHGLQQQQQTTNLNIWRDQGKLNNSNSSSSDFQHEKGLENVPPRPDHHHQGNNNNNTTVDSWICPSD